MPFDTALSEPHLVYGTQNHVSHGTHRRKGDDVMGGGTMQAAHAHDSAGIAHYKGSYENILVMAHTTRSHDSFMTQQCRKSISMYVWKNKFVPRKETS